jgi:hypothetical protein
MPQETMQQSQLNHPPFWRSPAGAAMLVLGAVAGFLLFTEHRAHVLGALPYLLILACPLMHFFMHHGHGHRGHHDTPDDKKSGQS